MRVCIIGAGVSGLAALKHSLEYGQDPLCLEGEIDLGGVWRFTEQESHSSVYRSTHINTGRDTNQYGDFPMLNGLPVLLHNSQILEYLRAYAKHFGLLQYIKFSANVTNATPKDGKWEITYAISNKEYSEIFDAVYICSGHHSTPRVPSWPGTFSGNITHSHVYKDNSPYVGKRVVVVGIGNSGSDIVSEVSKVASETVLVSRRGCWILRNPYAAAPCAKVSGRAETLILQFVPKPLMEAVLKSDLGKEQSIANAHGLTPTYPILSAHPTCTANYPGNDLFEQLKAGKIKVKKNIQRFENSTIVFDDNTSGEYDHVICCTGYKFGYPFLDKKVWDTSKGDNECPLYRFMFMPGYTNIAWIGLVQPIGSMFMISDVQSRFAALVFNGEVKLPSQKAMLQEVESRRNELKVLYVDSPRHTIQVFVRDYLDKLAADAGFYPTFAGLIWQFGIADTYRIMRAQTIGAHYRLLGNKRNPAVALNTINKEYNLLCAKSPKTTWVGALITTIVYIVLLVLSVPIQLYNLVRKGRIDWFPVF